MKVELSATAREHRLLVVLGIAGRSMIEADDEYLSLRHELIQISDLVVRIHEELQRRGADTGGFTNIITPYRLVVSLAADVRKYSSYDMPSDEVRQATLGPLLTHLRWSVADLDRYHRAARVIGLIECAKLQNVLQQEVERLKALLDIDEIAVVPGDELLDYKNLNLDIAGSEGEGVRSVISAVVEPGYKKRTTGAVIKQPRVRVRFED